MEAYDRVAIMRLSSFGPFEVAVVIYSESRRSNVWLYDVQLGTKTRVAEGIMPVWFPDGRRRQWRHRGDRGWRPAPALGDDAALGRQINLVTNWFAELT